VKGLRECGKCVSGCNFDDATKKLHDRVFKFLAWILSHPIHRNSSPPLCHLNELNL